MIAAIWLTLSLPGLVNFDFLNNWRKWNNYVPKSSSFTLFTTIWCIEGKWLFIWSISTVANLKNLFIFQNFNLQSPTVLCHRVQSEIKNVILYKVYLYINKREISTFFLYFQFCLLSWFNIEPHFFIVTKGISHP